MDLEHYWRVTRAINLECEMTDDQLNGQEEEWRPVPWFPGYEVSSFGQVRSWLIRQGVRRRFPLYRKLIRDKRGYLRLTLCSGSHSPEQRVEGWLVHRLVLSVFRPCESPDLDAAHLNGDKQDNRLENLVWASRKENEGHKRRHGTVAKGSRNGQSKLTERDALAIRDLHFMDGLSQGTLAKRFRVCQGTVSALILGKTWASLD